MPDPAKKTGGGNYFQFSPDKENKKSTESGQRQGENDIKSDIGEIINDIKTDTVFSDITEDTQSEITVSKESEELSSLEETQIESEKNDSESIISLIRIPGDITSPENSVISDRDDVSGEPQIDPTDFVPEAKTEPSPEDTAEDAINSEIDFQSAEYEFLQQPDDAEVKISMTDEKEQPQEIFEIDNSKLDDESEDLLNKKEEKSDSSIPAFSNESDKPEITGDTAVNSELLSNDYLPETEKTNEEPVDFTEESEDKSNKTEITAEESGIKPVDLTPKIIIAKTLAKFKNLLALIQDKIKLFFDRKKTDERKVKVKVVLNRLKSFFDRKKTDETKAKVKVVLNRVTSFFDRKSLNERKAAIISIIAALTILIGSAVLISANYIFRNLPTGLDTHISSRKAEVRPVAANNAFKGLDDKVNIRYTIRGTQATSLTTDKITVGEFMRQISDKLTPAEDGSDNWEYVVNYSKSTVLENDMELKMDLVTFIDTEIFEAIPYETKTIETDTIPKGTKILLRSGISGTADCIYRERYLNGELQSSEKISETIDIKPQTEVVYEGVGGKFQAPNGQWYDYLYYFDAEATAYGVDTGWGGDGDYVASGKRAQIGMIAVDPKVIPLGSKCYVIGDSYNIGVVYAEDVGGAIIGNKIDIYMGDDLDAQLKFGRRQMRVYVLDLPD